MSEEMYWVNSKFGVLKKSEMTQCIKSWIFGWYANSGSEERDMGYNMVSPKEVYLFLKYDEEYLNNKMRMAMAYESAYWYDTPTKENQYSLNLIQNTTMTEKYIAEMVRDVVKKGAPKNRSRGNSIIDRKILRIAGAKDFKW